MTDLFSKENIQVNDINLPTGAEAAIDALGNRTSNPSGTPQNDNIQIDAPKAHPEDGSALPVAPDGFSGNGDKVAQADNPDPAPPQDPNNLNSNPSQPGISGDALAASSPPAMPPVAPPQGPRDLFAAEGIDAPAPPTLPEQNQAALDGGANVTDPKTPQDHVAAAFVNSQQDQTMQLAASRYTPEQIQAIKDKGPIKFSEIPNFLDSYDVLPGGGLFKAGEAVQLLGAANKLKSGISYKDLSVNEQDVLDHYIGRQIEMNLRGFGTGISSIPARMAYASAQIPAFMVEFAASGGIGKAAEEAVLNVSDKAAINSTLATVTSVAAKSTVRASTSLLPEFAANLGERRIADGVTVTDKGQLLSRQSTESPAMSALKSFGYTEATAFGQDIAGPLVGAIGPTLKTPISAGVNYLPVAVKQGLYDAYKLMEPNAQVSKIFSAVGWHGMIEQLGANRVTQVLQQTIDADKDSSFEDYLSKLVPKKDDFLVEAGLISIAGGIHAATSLTSNLLQAKGVAPNAAEDIVKNMSASEQDNFVNDNLKTPASNYPSSSMVHADEIGSKSSTENMDANVMKSQTLAAQKVNPPPVAEDQSSFNKLLKGTGNRFNEFYALFVNDLQPIEDLTTKAKNRGAEIPTGFEQENLVNNAKSSMGLTYANIEFARMARDGETGELRETGKSLKAIYDDFDNMFQKYEPDTSQRSQDFHDYQTAHSQLELAGTRSDYEISPEQIQKYQTNLLDLGRKYGKDFPFLETFAQENREWRMGIIHDNLVKTGLKSEEWFKELGEGRQKYAPAYRVFDENENQFDPSVGASSLKKDPNANRIGSLKRASGSEREIKHIFESDVKNAAQMVQKGAANMILQSVAKFKEFYPEDVKVVKPRFIANEVTASYDPKLRAKLEATIKVFGDELQRSEKPKANNKNVLGSYSPSENLVRMKIGSTEGTMAHEVGHMLDYKLGLKEKMLSDPEIKKELQKLSDDRLFGKIELGRDPEDELHFRETLDGSEGTKKYREYIKNDREVIANFFDAYVNSPDQVKEIAPKALKAFDKIIDENKDLAFIKDIKPSTSRAEEVIRKPVRDMSGPKNSIPFYEEGQRKFLEVSKPLQKAFEGFNQGQRTVLRKFLEGAASAQKKMLQIGATSLPGFLERHPIRGAYLAFLNTHGKATPVDFAKGIFDVMGASDEYQKWKAASGGLQRGMKLNEQNLEDYRQHVLGDKTIMSMVNPKALYKNLKILIDHPQRMAVFRAELRAGTPENEAAVKSLRATLDYSRSGSFVKKLGLASPFLNVEIQGVDMMYKAFKKNPGAYTAAAMLAITIPQVLFTGYYLYGADDKTRKQYLQLNGTQKTLAMNIKIGNEWIPIARPFTPGYIFGAIPEQIMIHLYKNSRPEAADFYGNMISGLLKSAGFITDPTEALPPVLKAYFEARDNKNFYFGNHLYPPEKDSLPAYARSNPNDSDLSKFLGKQFNISPAVIDNTIQEMSGNLGKFVVQNIDAAGREVQKIEGKKVSEKPSAFENNVLSRGLIAHDPIGNYSQSVQEFYDRYEEAQKIDNQQKALKNDEKDQQEFTKNNKQGLQKFELLNDAHKDISDINKQIKEVNASTSLSGDKKQSQLDRLQQQMTNIAEQVNEKYDKRFNK